MTTPPLEATTDAIRSLTIYAAMQDLAGTEEQAGTIFDEWLARVIRQAKAEALREAAAYLLNRAWPIDFFPGVAGSAHDLEARASRIEAGE